MAGFVVKVAVQQRIPSVDYVTGSNAVIILGNSDSGGPLLKRTHFNRISDCYIYKI
jgi:hypothetical protein